jgi:hypothetical protein
MIPIPPGRAVLVAGPVPGGRWWGCYGVSVMGLGVLRSCPLFQGCALLQ